MPMSSAERQRAYIARLKAGILTAPKRRKPIDRRTKPQCWDDAVAELVSLLDDYQQARDTCLTVWLRPHMSRGWTPFAT